jgi:hypothetical protein
MRTRPVRSIPSTPQLELLGRVRRAFIGLRIVRERLVDQDRRASANGWTVSAGRWGRRTYRDPRFDLLQATRSPELTDLGANVGARSDEVRALVASTTAAGVTR